MAEFDSIASEATSNETELYALARPAAPEEETAGITCELWLDWFCHGSRTKSCIQEGKRREFGPQTKI